MLKKLFLSLILMFLLNQIEAKNTIHILLTNPRSLSTAFECSMRARGDHKVLHEPWGTTVINILKEPTYQNDSQTYENIKLLVYRYAQQEPVFLKEHTWMLKNHILKDDALFSDSDVIFTLLIRDPALSIESFFPIINKISNSASITQKITIANTSCSIEQQITNSVYCYEELFLLAEKHYAMRGRWPIVIDAEDLNIQPEETIKAFCKYANIDFKEKALTWEESFSPSPWHAKFANSRGFFKSERDSTQSRFAAIPKEFVPGLELVYQKNKPFYEKLKAIKLKVGDSSKHSLN